MARRVENDAVLLHDIRYRFYKLLDDRGPQLLKDVAEECGVSPANMLWHARKMEVAGIVVRDDGRQRPFRRLNTAEARRALAVRLLQDRAVRGLLEQAAKYPGRQAIDSDAIGQQVHQLTAHGLIQVRDWDGGGRIFPTAFGQHILNDPRTKRLL